MTKNINEMNAEELRAEVQRLQNELFDEVQRRINKLCEVQAALERKILDSKKGMGR